MLKLDIISFEQAKALHELGFTTKDNNQLVYYIKNNKVDCAHFVYFTKLVKHGLIPEQTYYEAPTLELVAKWLREKKGLHINYNVCVNKDIHKWNLYNIFDFINDIEYDCFISFNSYEEALSAGIDKAIEILKSNNYDKRRSCTS